MLRVLEREPAVALPRGVVHPEGRVGSIEPVGLLGEALIGAVILVLQKEPFERALEIPFYELAEFAAHELQLLAGECYAVGRQQAQLRELGLDIALHAADEQLLPVNDLVMREGQHVMLREGVGHLERELVLMVLPVNAVELEVGERIVHEAHVPLVIEAEPLVPRHVGVSARFLGDHGGGRARMHGGVELLYEVLRGVISVGAVEIRPPLRLAEIEV